MINVDLFENQWKEIRENVRPRWPALTDTNVDLIDGHIDVLIDLLQEKYGYSRSLAEDEVNRFLRDAHAVRTG